MIEKLKSHLRNKKGFTLIELLIVIAIIAVLVLIVIVAINPVQRLNDANDRTAAANVRAAGTLIATCVTEELADNDAVTDCDDAATELNAYGNVPADVFVDIDANSNVDICATQQGSDANFYIYRLTTGETVETTGTLGATAALRCP